MDQVHDTDLLKDKAIDFITDQRGEGKPFFAYVAPNAPHTPAYVPARHESMFSERSLPRPPSFSEEDMSDKPRVVRSPQFSHDEVKDLGDLYRKRLASLQSVDGMVGAIVTALRDTGQLDSTYIIFASDNGFFLGEHRRVDKSLPYEESIRIPLVVRGPGVPAQKVNHLVVNNDFAPTVAQLAGVDPPDFVDGKSFVPLLRDEKPPLEAWRTGFLVEHVTPTYQALRTNDHTYVEWAGGDRELYDLDEDPYQLRSSYDVPANRTLIDGLKSQLGALRDCTADLCRAAEVQ
jgi:N-acetylglucosamine-6-sulfatase